MRSNFTLEPDSPETALLERYARIVLRENARLNLTADATPELFRARHLEDGLLGCRALEQAGLRPQPGQSGLDVGSGAGLPGVVFAVLWPRLRWTLLDARRKRTDFLKALIAELGLPDIETQTGRVETFAHDPGFRERFSIVLARALAPLPALAELTLPFVRPGGVVAAFKSQDIGDELAQAHESIRAMGGDPGDIQLLPYDRPDGKSCQVVVIRKTSPTPPQYPRRDGLPARRPII